MKYAHLKVKSRQGQTGGTATADTQASESVESPSEVAEHRTKPPSAFQMPKSLHDPSILSKPLDPLSLFGATTEDDSLPFSRQPLGGGSQKFGEITMNEQSQEKLDHSRPTATNLSTLAMSEGEAVSGSAVANDEPKKGGDATTLPYYAMFDTGLGGDDLEIDSAFGELS